jgi:DNA modification methylase
MIVTGDSIKEISKIEGEVQTWIMDPPYNINYDYGNNFDDNLDTCDYNKFIHSLALEMRLKSKESSSFFLIHYPEDAARLLPHIESTGWVLNQWISWVYPTNFGMSKKRFTKAHRAVLWFKVDVGEPKFNHRIKGEYKDPKDKRIKKQIEAGNKPALLDWMEINLVKKGSHEHVGYFNQIPKKLLEILILNTTDEGDLVADPCAGSGSTIKTAILNNRKGWGCDINPVSKHMFSFWLNSTLLEVI